MRMIFGAIGGMKFGKGNRSTLRKPTPAPLCPPQNPTWQTRSRTPDRNGGKPATNRLSYGAAFLAAFRRLLRLSGSRWRYSTPPPHGFNESFSPIVLHLGFLNHLFLCFTTPNVLHFFLSFHLSFLLCPLLQFKLTIQGSTASGMSCSVMWRHISKDNNLHIHRCHHYQRQDISRRPVSSSPSGNFCTNNE
jgi:hypothetical protein